MKEHVKNGKILYHDLPFWNIQYPCNELKEALVRYLASMEQSGYSELTIRETDLLSSLKICWSFVVDMTLLSERRFRKMSISFLQVISHAIML